MKVMEAGRGETPAGSPAEPSGLEMLITMVCESDETRAASTLKVHSYRWFSYMKNWILMG